jgi:hypothetical protein
MKFLSVLLSITGLLMCTANAVAVTEYDFEMIIFEDKSGRYSNSEQWQHELRESDTLTTSAESLSQDGKPKPASKDSSATVKRIKGIGLGGYAKKLKSSKRYNVLVHKAWRQAGLGHKDAFDIPIDSRPPGATQQAIGTHIEGNIRIVLARYLHFYADMIYKQPRTGAAPVWYDPEARLYKQYPIKSHRRMRSKELHYLDHPMVGILIKAMPVKTKEETG